MTTTSIAWTPGPWTLDTDGYEIVAADDAVLARIYTRDDFPCADPDDVEVWDRAGVEFEANGYLIAAAPDLYAALNRLVNHDMSKEAWQQAHAALALVRGNDHE